MPVTEKLIVPPAGDAAIASRSEMSPSTMLPSAYDRNEPPLGSDFWSVWRDVSLQVAA